MIDTGMNRLGVRADELTDGLLSGLTIDVAMSHLASADEDSAQNEAQIRAFRDLRGGVAAARYSLANSAGICLGSAYAFDLTRPGLALYGGIPRGEAAGSIRPVLSFAAQLLQRRMVPAGESVGYGATWTARGDTPVGIINFGYADGFWRALGARGCAEVDGYRLPIIGRVSMDLIALDLSAASALGVGDWVDLPLNLPAAATATGLSQYELLTGLGQRFDRVWR
jgi:alanine racemase